MHWSYCRFALSHQNIISYIAKTCDTKSLFIFSVTYICWSFNVLVLKCQTYSMSKMSLYHRIVCYGWSEQFDWSTKSPCWSVISVARFTGAVHYSGRLTKTMGTWCPEYFHQATGVLTHRNLNKFFFIYVDNSFKCISWMRYLINIDMKCVFEGLMDNKSTFIQVMACCHMVVCHLWA